MKKWQFLFSFFFALCFVTTSFGAGIEFYHGTWQDALKQAQEEGKIVFVDAYTTWCGPCKRMSRNVFTQAPVGDLFNENFVSIKVDMEKTNGREFGAKYPVSAYPTLFFLEPTGKIIKKVVGGKQVEQLVALGEDVIKNFDYSAAERKAYEDGDRSFATVLGFIQGMNKSGKSSLKVANDFLLSEHGMTDVEMSKFLFAAATEVDSKIFDKMLARKSKIIAVVGEEAFIAKINNAASKTVDKAIKFEDKSLMKQACATVKKHNKAASKVFDSKAKMKLAVSEKNAKNYVKASKIVVKGLASMDEKVDFAQQAMKDFPKDKLINEQLYSILKPAVVKPANKDQIGVYIKLLVELGKKEEALAYLKSVESLFTDQKTINQLKNLTKYVERYKVP